MLKLLLIINLALLVSGNPANPLDSNGDGIVDKTDSTTIITNYFIVLVAILVCIGLICCLCQTCNERSLCEGILDVILQC